MTRYIVLLIPLLAGCTPANRQISIDAQVSTLCYFVKVSINVTEEQ